MGWSTSAPSGITWGDWTTSGAVVHVNNYYNYRIQSRVGRGSENNIAVAVQLQVYGYNYGSSYPYITIPLYAAVRISNGSWNNSSSYDCSGNFGAWVTGKTLYWTGTASVNASVQAKGSWQGNDTGTNATPAPAYKTTYTISYNANGGSGAPASQTKTYNTTLTLSSTRPTRTGYTFKGWATSSAATTAQYQPGGSYTANASATLYAVWSIIQYTITYKANGGTGADQTQTKNYGSAVALKAADTFTRQNYSFLYWNTAADGSGDTYYAGDQYTDNENKTLYAIWKKNNIPVYVNDDGTIRQVEKAYINDGGTIKECTVYMNVGGTIKVLS